MRQIKFRGKMIDKGEWAEGYLGSGGLFGQYPEKCWIFTNGKFVEVIPETVGQFIGLKDKNKREVCEGDIVRVHRTFRNGEESFYTDGVVEFSDGCFWIRGDGYADIQHFHFNDSDREIIGNIYEPSLNTKPIQKQ